MANRCLGLLAVGTHQSVGPFGEEARCWRLGLVEVCAVLFLRVAGCLGSHEGEVRCKFHGLRFWFVFLVRISGKIKIINIRIMN